MKLHPTNQSHWIGLGLSIIFTIIPFYVVEYNFFQKNVSLIIIILCAITQIYVHLTFFLHLGHALNQEWYIVSLIFTVFILLILILGSIWIMTHLHTNLMIENIH